MGMCVKAFEMCEEVVGVCEWLNAGWDGLWVDEAVGWHEQKPEAWAFGAACDGTLSPAL